MKTANELLMSHRSGNTYKLNLRELTDALTEHDKEIIGLIDEMIMGNVKKQSFKGSIKSSMKDVADGMYGVEILTELKERIGSGKKTI